VGYFEVLQCMGTYIHRFTRLKKSTSLKREKTDFFFLEALPLAVLSGKSELYLILRGFSSANKLVVILQLSCFRNGISKKLAGVWEGIQ